MISIDSRHDRKIEIDQMTATGESEKLAFYLRPQSYDDIIQVQHYIEKNNLKDEKDGMFYAACYAMILRVTAWEGIANGNQEPAECSLENKILFFGQYFQVLSRLLVDANKKEEEEIKN